MVSSSNSKMAHISDVWSRNSYFNFGYNLGSSLTPKNDMTVKGYGDLDGKKMPKFDYDFGLMAQLGNNIKLHKKPIANMVRINLDFTYIDLNYNQYKANDGFGQYTEGTNSTKPLPWLSKKYELSYGMSLGPSVTVAPFSSFNFPSDLHYLKINGYAHFGYEIAFLGMSEYKNGSHSLNFDCINFGYGRVWRFGLNVSWKFIGLGWETRIAYPKYKCTNSDYGKESYNFKSSSNRIYLTIRY